MIIQINSDKSLTWEQRSADFFTTQIADALERYESNITRIEVHLKDENSKKEGISDISCMLEARLEGLKPIAVTNHDETVDKAVTGAIDKIKSSIEKIVDKRQKH